MARVQKATESRVEMTLASHQPDETTNDETALAAVRNRIIADASLEQFLKEWADGVMQLPALERELERQHRIAVMKPLYGEAERLVDAALADAQAAGRRRLSRASRSMPPSCSTSSSSFWWTTWLSLHWRRLRPSPCGSFTPTSTSSSRPVPSRDHLGRAALGQDQAARCLGAAGGQALASDEPDRGRALPQGGADAPTILFDETDTVFGPKAGSNYEGIRALLNAATGGAPRCRVASGRAARWPCTSSRSTAPKPWQASATCLTR